MQWLPLYPPSHQAGPTPSVPTPRGDNHPPVSLSPFFSSWILPGANILEAWSPLAGASVYTRDKQQAEYYVYYLSITMPESTFQDHHKSQPSEILQFLLITVRRVNIIQPKPLTT